MPVVFTGREDAPAVSAAPVSVEKSVPVEHFPQSETTISGNGSGAKLTKVVMIFNQSRFVALKEALTELGVTGIKNFFRKGDHICHRDFAYYNF